MREISLHELEKLKRDELIDIIRDLSETINKIPKMNMGVAQSLASSIESMPKMMESIPKAMESFPANIANQMSSDIAQAMQTIPKDVAAQFTIALKSLPKPDPERSLLDVPPASAPVAYKATVERDSMGKIKTVFMVPTSVDS